MADRAARGGRPLSAFALTAGTAAILVLLRRDPTRLVAHARAPREWMASAGPDRVLATLAGTALWLTACWVAIGLVAAAAARLPGSGGRIAAGVSQVLLPRVLLRVVAGTAGLGVVLTPVAAGADQLTRPTPAAVASACTPARGGPVGVSDPASSVAAAAMQSLRSDRPTTNRDTVAGIAAATAALSAIDPSATAPSANGWGANGWGATAPSAAADAVAGGAAADAAADAAVDVAVPASRWVDRWGDGGLARVPGPVWPVSPSVPPPRWPSSPSRGTSTGHAGERHPGGAPDAHRVSTPRATARVHAGDSLWLLAARRLGADATDSRIASYWPRLYAANRAAIGDDPAAIHPGQVLREPAPTLEEMP